MDRVRMPVAAVHSADREYQSGIERDHCDHVQKRPATFECYKCQQRFQRPDHLRAHLEVRECMGSVCNVCGFVFPQRDQLEKHVLQHCGEENTATEARSESFRELEMFPGDLASSWNEHKGIGYEACRSCEMQCDGTRSESGNCQHNHRRCEFRSPSLGKECKTVPLQQGREKGTISDRSEDCDKMAEIRAMVTAAVSSSDAPAEIDIDLYMLSHVSGLDIIRSIHIDWDKLDLPDDGSELVLYPSSICTEDILCTNLEPEHRPRFAGTVHSTDSSKSTASRSGRYGRNRGGHGNDNGSIFSEEDNMTRASPTDPGGHAVHGHAVNLVPMAEDEGPQMPAMLIEEEAAPPQITSPHHWYHAGFAPKATGERASSTTAMAWYAAEARPSSVSLSTTARGHTRNDATPLTAMLPCEMAPYLGCDKEFKLYASGYGIDQWTDHLATVHLGMEFPTNAGCWFCSKKYSAGSGAHTAIVFKERMRHIARHFLNGNARPETQKLDPEFAEHLRERGLLQANNYEPTPPLTLGTVPVKSCHEAVINVDWPLCQFLETEFPSRSPLQGDFCSIITLTGNAADAQALTIYEYLSQTWPDIVGNIVPLLPASIYPEIDNHPTRQIWIDQEGFIKVDYTRDGATITAYCQEETLIQSVQAFTWLSCVLRPSPDPRGAVWTSVPVFSEGVSKGDSGICILNIDFLAHERIPSTDPGMCWHSMFQGAMLASGFPIKSRAESGLGLEMPLNLLAHFGGSRRVTEWGNKLFIKGYSTMLVATKVVADLLVWHYHYRGPGDRLSYMDSTDEVPDAINVAEVARFRHIAGWCSGSKYCAGSADASYNIGRSRLPRPSAGFFLDKVSISAGKMISGGVTFSPGVKDTPPQLTRNGNIPKLKWLYRRYVVLWDDEAKRGWLVNGTSALLHLVRASLESYEKDDFSSCFQFDNGMMNNFERRQHKPKSAIEVLTNQGNRSLPIYPDGVTRRDEEATMPGKETNSSSSTKSTSYFLFGDLVDQHLSTLEQMIEYHQHLAGQDGVNLKVRVRKHLEGWNFADLAADYDAKPRVTTIPALGHGWVDFVRSIEAITLFGCGFGELIQPVQENGLCLRWRSLPTQNYLLAASVVDLEDIMEQYGDPYSVPRKLAQNILWHSPAEMSAACPCQAANCSKAGAKPAHVDPVQVLLPSNCRRRLYSANGPVELDQDGAVVFGHNATMGYRWPEQGTEEVPVSDFLLHLRQSLSVRLWPKAGPDETLDTQIHPDTDEAFTLSNVSSNTSEPTTHESTATSTDSAKLEEPAISSPKFFGSISKP